MAAGGAFHSEQPPRSTTSTTLCTVAAPPTPPRPFFSPPPRYISTIEFSHQRGIADLQWLPGLEVTNKGKLAANMENSKECNFFATMGMDGKVMFWDVRVEQNVKKKKKSDDLSDIEWRMVGAAAVLPRAKPHGTYLWS